MKYLLPILTLLLFASCSLNLNDTSDLHPYSMPADKPTGLVGPVQTVESRYFVNGSLTKSVWDSLDNDCKMVVTICVEYDENGKQATHRREHAYDGKGRYLGFVETRDGKPASTLSYTYADTIITEVRSFADSIADTTTIILRNNKVWKRFNKTEGQIYTYDDRGTLLMMEPYKVGDSHHYRIQYSYKGDSLRYDVYFTDDILKDTITHGYDFFRNENWYISAGLTKVSEYDYDEYGSWVKKEKVTASGSCASDGGEKPTSGIPQCLFLKTVDSFYCSFTSKVDCFLDWLTVS